MECVQWRPPHSPSLGTSMHSRPRNPFAETTLRHPTWLAPVLVYEPLLHSLFTCSHREGREAPAGVTQVPSRAPDGTSAGDGWRLLSRPRQALRERSECPCTAGPSRLRPLRQTPQADIYLSRFWGPGACDRGAGRLGVWRGPTCCLARESPRFVLAWRAEWRSSGVPCVSEGPITSLLRTPRPGPSHLLTPSQQG